jgi:hypothetical protein
MAEHLQITPAGVGILFEDGEKDLESGKGKKRCYTIAQLPMDATTRSTEVMAYVRENGQQLPSVTTVLGMLEKPGLMWWSEKLAVAGCIELARDGGLPLKTEAALGQLTRHGLRHFQVSEQKAERGKLSHEDIVHLAAGRTLPPLSEYPEDQRGFIQGLASFLADYRPSIEASELMVASLEHGFSGRLDVIGTLGVKTQPNGRPAPRGRGQIDLKSHDELPRTKGGKLKTPYPEHQLQVGLYEVGYRESGYEPTDWRAIVRVDSHGNYDFTVSWIEPERAPLLLPVFRLFRDAGSRVKTDNDTMPVGLGQEVAA